MRFLYLQSVRPDQGSFWKPVASVTVRLCGAAAMLATLSGCQNIAGSVPVAMVRVIDASPDAPGVDIYQGGSGLAYNLGFGTVTSYVAIAPGASAISSNTTGSRQQLTTAGGTFAASAEYTVLIGNVAGELTETVFMDQSVGAPAGQISVRMLHQATRFTVPVDVYFVQGKATLTTVAPILTNALFGANGGYVNVPTGTYSIFILPAGTAPTSKTIPTYTGAKIAYPEGAARTFILLDQPASAEPGFQVITAEDYTPPSTVG